MTDQPYDELDDDDDLSEVDTTQKEFEIMWARADSPGTRTWGCVPKVIWKRRFGTDESLA